jgi:DNA repair exonuclease SbcCD ATPase subunit
MSLKLTIQLDLKNEKEARGLLDRLDKDYEVDVDVDTRKAEKGIKRILKGVKSIGSRVTNIFAMVGLAIDGIRESVRLIQSVAVYKNAARDANEIENKYLTVFETIRKKAQEVAEELANGFGLANSTAMELLGNTGDILVGFGFSEEMALNLSNMVNKLAVDLASFTNFQGGARRASEALTKAILGETESAKALGIVLRQGTEDFKNRVEALKETNGYTENQARAVTLLNEAYRQSKKAVGDFARTQDQLANMERVLEESYKEFKIWLGEQMIPAFKEMTKNAIKFFDSFTESNVEALEKSKQAIDNFENKAEKLVNLKNRYEDLKDKASLNAQEHEKLKDVIGDIAEVVPEAAVGFDAYGNAIDVNIQKIDEFIRKQRASLRLQFREQIEDVVNEYKDSFKHYSKLSEQYYEKRNRVAQAWWKWQNTGIEKLKRSYISALADYKNFIQEYNKEIPKLNVAFNSMVRALEGAGVDFRESPANIAYQLGLDLEKDRALIDRLINRYKMLKTTAKKAQSDENQQVISQKQIDKAQAELDKFFESLRSERERLAKEFQDKKSLLEIAYSDDPEKYKEKLKELNKWYQSEQDRIRDEEIKREKQEYREKIELLQAKKKLGLDVVGELKTAQDQYLEFLIKSYGKDSKEYAIALKDKREATKKFWQENHKLADGVIDSIGSSFRNGWNSIIDESRTGSEKLEALWKHFRESVWGVIGDITSKWIKDQLKKLAITKSVEQASRAEVVKTQAVNEASAVAQEKSLLSLIAIKIKSSLVTIGQAIAEGFKWLVSTLGPAGLGLGMALGAGLISAFNSFRDSLGFASGGYTGDGGKYEAAGIVHKKELVFESEITKPNLKELLGLRSLLQKGYRLRDLMLPDVQFPSLQKPQLAYGFAGGGYAGNNNFSDKLDKILYFQSRIEKAIKNKKLDGLLELEDKRSGEERYRVHLKDKVKYERRNR